MAGPLDVLGVKLEDSDEVIRARYLELLRLHPPEQNAEKFNAIRSAYDKIKDVQLRVEYLLYHEGNDEIIDEVITDFHRNVPRQPVIFAKLVEAYHKANQ